MIERFVAPGRITRALGAILAVVLAVAPALGAQEHTGRIVGRIIDAQTGIGLTDVGIQVVGTTLGASSGVDGRFTIAGIPAGTVTLHTRRLGYTPKTVTGITLEAGQSVEQVVSLQAATITLQAQVVTASAERGTVSEALDRQRNAAGVVSAVTAEQIARSPDANAAQAVQRVSGVTVQDGRYVFVRGLGERYTTTSLNGARLPSPEPERKVVPLDLFPAGLLQSVTTTKTFTPDQPGDFSGATVDITTREFPLRRTTTYSASIGFNGAATGRSVLAAPTVGSEWLGFAGRARELPGIVRASGNFSQLTTRQNNEVVRAFRNAWTPTRATGAPNSSLAASVGGTQSVFGHPVGYVGSASYAYTQEARANEQRALAVPTSDSTQRAANQTVGETGRTSVLWGGLFNLSSLVGQRSRIAMNNMYSRTADNEARADTGFLDFGTENPTRRSTLLFVEREIRSNQLLGEHSLGARHALDWALTSAAVKRREPDRADLVYVRNEQFGADQPYALYGGSDDGAKRSFSTLDEHSVSAGTNYTLRLGDVASGASMKVGGLFRDTHRDVVSRNYSIFVDNLTIDEAAAPAEELFRRYTTDTSQVFRPTNNSAAGSYTASDRVSAGYAMAELPLGSRLRLLGGARVEDWRLRLVTERLFANDVNIATPSATDVLPSLALTVRLGETQQLRVSAARTLSRPEYREVSPILARDVIGERSTIGNPALRRALIDNVDVRWEAYPGSGEAFSVALFAKRFHDPIERVEVATSGATNYSFVNADGANNYGVELEARKDLGSLASVLAPVSVFANATLMRSTITPGNDDISALTNASRPMVGQAPYVVNTGLSWSGRRGASATLLYNVVGRRITAAASTPLPDTYQEARHVIDATVQVPVTSVLTLKLTGKNLLDSEYRETQGSVTRLSYRTGRALGMGLTWRP